MDGWILEKDQHCLGEFGVVSRDRRVIIVNQEAKEAQRRNPKQQNQMKVTLTRPLGSLLRLPG